MKDTTYRPTMGFAIIHKAVVDEEQPTKWGFYNYGSDKDDFLLEPLKSTNILLITIKTVSAI